MCFGGDVRKAHGLQNLVKLYFSIEFIGFFTFILVLRHYLIHFRL